MHALDLQQLAEAAMLQQSREGDGHGDAAAGSTRLNPRRSVNGHSSASNATTAEGSGTAQDAGNTHSRTTRQRSARNSAASASSTSSTPLASSSFARSPSSRGAAGSSSNNNSTGNGNLNSNSTGSSHAGSSNHPPTASAENDVRLAAHSTHTPSSARQPGMSSTSDPSKESLHSTSASSPARISRRKDRKSQNNKTASISSINTVKSSLSATSAATSTPSLSHSATDPSISSAASDISSRTSEGTHATTPEHVSPLDAMHVLYAKGGQHHPSYSTSVTSIPPPSSNIPYPVYHNGQDVTNSIASGKTGPVYHQHDLPQRQAISAGNGGHQAQHAYVNLQGRSFDPSQVHLYTHDGQDDARPNHETDLLLGNNEDNGSSGSAVRYFIDPYALPSNHPYHPSNTHSLHLTTQLHQQHGGLNYATSVSAPSLSHDSHYHHQQQQHYATTALPPLPSPALGGADYLMQYSNAAQSHHQGPSGGYNGNGGGNGHRHSGAGLDASTSLAANASTSTSNGMGDTTINALNEDASLMSSKVEEEAAEQEDDQEGALPPLSVVPAKKQKGRRPTNTNLESKNHKCKFENCNWSFSRREHLRRHEKTHTQDRPFLCDIPLCGLRFSRLDNLNSHKRTHDKGKRTSQWHVAKIVGAQQAARSGSGSVMGDGSEDGRASAEGSTSVLQPAPMSANHSGIDEPLPSHSAGGSGSAGQNHHFIMPGSATLQQNGFPALPQLDNSMNSGNDTNGGSTVGAEVRFAYYDPSHAQPPHSGGAPQQHHSQHSMTGLGGPYGNVRGYQDPFSYQAPPPPPPHGISVHSSTIAHSHLPSHPAQQHHHQMQQQQHSYHHQPLPPLPPHMHDESAYMHHHQSQQQQQQQQHHHLPPHLQAGGMVNGMPHHEYDNNVYSTEHHQQQQQIPHHLMQHSDQQQQNHHLQAAIPPPPPPAAPSNKNSKRKRNESHLSNNSSSHINNVGSSNIPILPQPQQIANQLESPSHKRRQSGRKGGVNA